MGLWYYFEWLWHRDTYISELIKSPIYIDAIFVEAGIVRIHVYGFYGFKVSHEWPINYESNILYNPGLFFIQMESNGVLCKDMNVWKKDFLWVEYVWGKSLI